MKKETKYVAPEVEIISAQVEKGFAPSGNGGMDPGEDPIPGGEL